MSWLLYVFVISSSPPPSTPCLLFSFKSTSESSNEKSYKYGPPQRFPPILYTCVHIHFEESKTFTIPCFLLGSNPFRVVCPSVNVFDVRHLNCVDAGIDSNPKQKYLMVCIVYSLFPFFPLSSSLFFMSLLSLYHPFLVNKYGKCDGQQTIKTSESTYHTTSPHYHYLPYYIMSTFIVVQSGNSNCLKSNTNAHTTSKTIPYPARELILKKRCNIAMLP